MSATTTYIDVSDLLRYGGRTGIARVVSQVVPRLVVGADDGVRMLRFDPIEHRFEELETTSMLEVLAGAGEAAAVVTGHRDIGDFGPSDVFLDIGRTWTSPLQRSTLYPRLKEAGATIVS